LLVELTRADGGREDSKLKRADGQREEAKTRRFEGQIYGTG
jgi:hypothetical protein